MLTKNASKFQGILKKNFVQKPSLITLLNC